MGWWKRLAGCGVALYLLLVVAGEGSAVAYGERGSREDTVLADAAVLRNDTFLLDLFLAVSTAKMGGHHVVKKVLDGRSLLLDNNERVRLMGVQLEEDLLSDRLCEGASGAAEPQDVTQTVQYQATAFAENRLQGKRVRVEYEHANSPLMVREREGERLVYVFLEDGTLVNAEMIKEGYGRADGQFTFRFMDEFRRYEREATKEHRGLWAGLAGETSHCGE